MKKISQLYALFLSGMAMLFVVSSCSDLQNELPSPSTGKTIHPPRWLTTTSSDFHGQEIRQQGWSLENCKTCHGSTYAGGVSNVSCLTCHDGTRGPENCSTCHGSAAGWAPPRDLSNNTSATARGVGAHQIHLTTTTRARAVGCTECHSVPGTLNTPGHVDDGDNSAEVMMTNSLANYATNVPGRPRYVDTLATVVPNPTYDRTTGSCSNTYCHGAFKNGNTTNVVVWTDPSTASCGTCHGNTTRSTPAERALPKTTAEGGNHPNNLSCSNCHGDVVNANLGFVDRTKHINGRLNVFGTEQEY